MSFANKDLIQSILFNQERQAKEVKELKRLQTRFKESEQAKKAKEWAYKEETQKKFDSVLSNFFLKNRSGKEVIV